MEAEVRFTHGALYSGFRVELPDGFVLIVPWKSGPPPLDTPEHRAQLVRMAEAARDAQREPADVVPLRAVS